jgi:hypothetical protein
MPENETLFPDVRTASRWQPLRDRIANGESPDQIFLDIQKQLYLALRSAFARWMKRGIDPKKLFEAALDDDRSVLCDLVNRVWNDEYARLLQDATSGEESLNLEAVLRLFLNSVWDCVRDHLQIDCREGGVPDAFPKRVDQMLDRLIRGLLENPSRVPRRPRQNKPPPDIDDTLGESLPLA